MSCPGGAVGESSLLLSSERPTSWESRDGLLIRSGPGPLRALVGGLEWTPVRRKGLQVPLLPLLPLTIVPAVCVFFSIGSCGLSDTVSLFKSNP